ncbi:MAG: glycerol-3-phosphate responsive antiterminator [Clostridia bacterium]|nr:glycerol-3-phosphate responsive antiterminator [Clostridia bacterium]
MASKLISGLHENPIIAAINNMAAMDEALQSSVNIIFLLTGDIFTLKETVERIKTSGKMVFIHVDLMEGFSKDATGVKYIIEEIHPDGIISTRSYPIKMAKEKGLIAIQRLFLLDSLNLDSGIKAVKTCRPDAIEILPGVMPKITKLIAEETKRPVITGGLIMDKSDVIEALKAGAIGISTSKEDIWSL